MTNELLMSLTYGFKKADINTVRSNMSTEIAALSIQNKPIRDVHRRICTSLQSYLGARSDEYCLGVYRLMESKTVKALLDMTPIYENARPKKAFTYLPLTSSELQWYMANKTQLISCLRPEDSYASLRAGTQGSDSEANSNFEWKDLFERAPRLTDAPKIDYEELESMMGGAEMNSDHDYRFQIRTSPDAES